MGMGSVASGPNTPVVFPFELSGEGYVALSRLCVFYKDDESKVIDRLLKEKAASLLGIPGLWDYVRSGNADRNAAERAERVDYGYTDKR